MTAPTRRVNAVFSHIAAPPEGGVSFLDLLLRRFTYHDEAEWREKIRAGTVLLDGRIASPGTVVERGMRLEYRVEGYEEPFVPIDFHEIAVAGDLALVHKPAGLPVHKTGRIFVHVLANLYRAFKHDDAWTPLNRLDVETSGIVAFARGPDAFRRFAPGTATWTKTYLTVVHGIVEHSGRIDGPLAELPGDVIRSRMHVTPGGKAATTLYQPLMTNVGKTLLLVRLLTGRKHQIRAHLASLGHPVVGDKMYSLEGKYYLKRLDGELSEEDLEVLEAPHQLLHAVRLEIRDAEGVGIKGEDLGVPEGFKRWFPGVTEGWLGEVLAKATF